MASWRSGVHKGLGFGHEAESYIEGGQHADPSKPYRSKGIQGFLPPWLQWYTGKGKNKTLSPFAQGLGKGTENLAALFANPGGFGPGLAEAIGPRVAMEQEAIGRGTAGGMAEAAGRASRSGTAGTGIAQALQAAIQQSGEREKATSLRSAQMDSAQLRRQDLASMLQTYQMLMEWTNAGRGTLQGQQQIRQGTLAGSRQGAQAASNMIGQIVSSIGGGMG
jgi:hypothetical protein